MTSAICDNMCKPTEYYAKCNMSNRERQISQDFTYMWNLEKQNKKINKTKQTQTQTEINLILARGVWGGRMHEKVKGIQSVIL